MAIELHDPSSSQSRSTESDKQTDSESESTEANLQPISPLDDEAAVGCLRDGRIHNVRLADLFDWPSVIAGASKRSFANLFYRRSEQKAEDVKLKSPASSEIPVEVGIDVVACLDDRERMNTIGDSINKDDTLSTVPDDSQSESKLAIYDLIIRQ